MARRRMFSLELISSDRFLGLAPSAQSFYFHLGMHADDEGFVAAPNSLGLLCHGTQQDLEQLEENDYIIRFDSGVLVIVDWLINNTIRKERSMETMHRTEKAMLELVNGRYALKKAERSVTETEPTADTKVGAGLSPKMDANFFAESAPQNRTEQNRKEENIIDHNRIVQNTVSGEFDGRIDDLPDGDWMEDEGKVSVYDNKPSLKDVEDFCKSNELTYINSTDFWYHYTINGWLDRDGKPVRDWRSLVIAWDKHASPKPMDDS